ncbi:hypothetical protein [Leptolyngbya sp. 7M]|uniref:hypothetical protein n=1 Tax=Leptolyngbya sp. 7M TaxID=2812896 RepID=UPI001B8CC4CB|nr:hypothetical protein [Leptolyngbya sp. 7M]QYO63624.1 hypothetical protein JVX88_27700 [Leptolyngbya sp. 7M]
MKLGYVIGALAGVAAGVAGTWGMNEYFSIKSDLQAVQQSTVVQATPQTKAAQPTSLQPSVAQSPVAQPTAAAVPNFDDLPLCDQLDAIAKASKSVAQFIADSGRYGQFAAHVSANCSWHSEQLAKANAILNPPVVPTRVVVQSTTVQSAAPSRPSAPSRPWNNCNGIQEPGESYSAACHGAQLRNDSTWGRRDPIDQRRRDPHTGAWPSPNGYSAN